jgi:hypothetical protein
MEKINYSVDLISPYLELYSCFGGLFLVLTEGKFISRLVGKNYIAIEKISDITIPSPKIGERNRA